MHTNPLKKACGTLGATTVSLRAISTALLRNADKAHEADTAAVAETAKSSSELFVRPATAADEAAIEVSQSVCQACGCSLALTLHFVRSAFHKSFSRARDVLAACPCRLYHLPLDHPSHRVAQAVLAV